MITTKHYQLVVVGAGPAGMAAAVRAKQQGITDILILERRDYLGGILPQCIHDGFGIYLYHQSLTGPEYATKWIEELRTLDIKIALSATALKISPYKETSLASQKKWLLSYLGKKEGMVTISTGTIVIATGCREKTLAQLHIPGSRPSGIYTAGSAQYMMNIQNYFPGKTAVILGSGDIGLIMARRMTLEGMRVKLILGEKSTGLVRNLVQCVEDFNIPIKYGFTVVSVHGYQRLKGVSIAPICEDGEIIMSEKKYIPCDTLLIAAGLVPEIELCHDSRLFPDTQTALRIDENLCIGQDGIFACGNVVKVHDLADSVSLEGQKAGLKAAQYLLSEVERADSMEEQKIEILEPKGRLYKEESEKDQGKRITCILCPKGCQILASRNATAEGSPEYLFSGYQCHRGQAYALEECTNPKRTVTTSVKIFHSTHPLLAVRTDKPIPKSKIDSVITAARKFTCNAPIALGTILIKNVAGTDANLISANEVLDMKKEKSL